MLYDYIFDIILEINSNIGIFYNICSNLESILINLQSYLNDHVNVVQVNSNNVVLDVTVMDFSTDNSIEAKLIYEDRVGACNYLMNSLKERTFCINDLHDKLGCANGNTLDNCSLKVLDCNVRFQNVSELYNNVSKYKTITVG